MGIEIAMLGAAVIGGISSNSAANKAADAQAQSDALTREGMEQQARVLGKQQVMDKQRYMDAEQEYQKWKAIYGPMQEDLGTYYSNLTGETLSNNEVERIQVASQNSRDQITQSMAQSGRANSGLEAELLAQNSYGAELAKAQSRSTADARAIDAKTNFLNMGLQQGNNIQQYQDNIRGDIAQSVYNPSQALASMGQGAVNTANTQNQIWNEYGGQIQGYMGYAAKTGMFDSTGSTGAMMNVADNLARSEFIGGM